MEIFTRQYGDVTIFTLHGRLDGTTASQLAKRINQSIDAGKVRLVADLAAVTFATSATVRVLMLAALRAQTSGGDFRLAAVQPQLKPIFNLAYINQTLKIYPTAVVATASYFQSK